MLVAVMVTLAAMASGLEGMLAGSTQGLEQGLLKALGLSRRPRPSGPIHVPAHMYQLYLQQTAGYKDTTQVPLQGVTANTVRSLPSKETTGGRRKRETKRRRRFRLVFNSTQIPVEESLTGAELRLDGVEGRVSVHDIVRPGVKGSSGPLLRLLDTTEQGALDVTPAVQRWAQEPDQVHGLLVEAVGDSSGHLLLFSQDTRHSRPKRAAQRKQRRKERDLCRRHPLFVDFADVGWNDWIVAPPGYEAFYCQGDCPFPLAEHMNSTNHAIVQTLVHSVHPSAVPKACCVPTQLSPISLLFLDEIDRVVLKNYQDMAVVGCGCR